MEKILKLCIFGISGRMGRELRAAVERRREKGDSIEILAGILDESDPFLGQVIPGVKFPASAGWQPEFADADVIVDFSSPAGALKAVAAAKESRLPLLECSTGLNSDEEAEVFSAAKDVPLLRTRNTSVGVNVMCKLVHDASKMIGEDFEIELVEIHHRFKKDAPSGTALMLLEEAARGRGNNLNDVLTVGRGGVGLSRAPGEISAQAVRGGDVAGEHTVYFLADGERVELTHRATSPRIFAEGALRAASWLAEEGRVPGVYTMFDVLEG